MPKYGVGDIIYTDNSVNDVAYALITKVTGNYYYYQFLNIPTATRSLIGDVDSSDTVGLWA